MPRTQLISPDLTIDQSEVGIGFLSIDVYIIKYRIDSKHEEAYKAQWHLFNEPHAKHFIIYCLL
jgi:hypothetical protein